MQMDRQMPSKISLRKCEYASLGIDLANRSIPFVVSAQTRPQDSASLPDVKATPVREVVDDWPARIYVQLQSSLPHILDVERAGE